MCFKTFKNNMVLEIDRFFLWVPVLFGLGIGIYFVLPFEIHPALIGLMIFLSVLCLVVGYQKKNVVLLSVFIVLAGLLNIQIQTKYQAQKVSFPDVEQTLYLSGRILKTDFSASRQMRLWLTDVSDFNQPLKGIYRIGVKGKNDLTIGSCVEMTATIFAPPPPLLPNGFQFDRNAFYEGISAIGYAETSVYEIDCEQKASIFSSFSMRLNRFRKSISSQIAKVLEPKEASVFSALLIGDKSLISDEQYRQYRDAGLAHFLSISGLHLGLMAGFAFLMTRLILLLLHPLALYLSVQKVAATVAVVLTFLYLMLSGFAVPAERAFVMVALVCVATLCDREAISLRTIAFAAIVILCVKPYALVSASFQLSFAAVTALVAFYEVFKNKNTDYNLISRIWVYFASVLTASFIASSATFIFAVYHFKVWSPYTLLGNVVATPFIVFLLMPMIFLNLILLPFGLNETMVHITGFLLSLLNRLSAWISSLPYADMHIKDVSFSALVLFVLGGLWLCLWQRKWRLYGFCLIGLGLIGCFVGDLGDVLYSKDGKTVGLRTSENELVIFSKKKNRFLNEVWGQNYVSFRMIKKPESMIKTDLICDEKKCVYQKMFEFDLNGNFKLNGKPIDAQTDLGGVIYFKNGKPKIKTVRESIGFKPWNM